MVAGCAISLLSAALAGWLLTGVSADTPRSRMQRGVPGDGCQAGGRRRAGSRGGAQRRICEVPLLFWLAMAYMALLPLEVRLAIL